jgi:hypothetical protein
MVMETSQGKPVTGPRFLLGLFILGQVLFLFLSNFLGILQKSKNGLPERWKPPIERLAPGFTRQKGHLWELTETLSRLTTLWDHLTGQTQRWSLFALKIRDVRSFPALELHWEDPAESAPAIAKNLSLLSTGSPLGALALGGLTVNQAMLKAPELVLSDNEPPNIECYFRAGNFRLRRFENNITLDLASDGQETPQQTAELWRDKISKYLRENGYLVLPYMKWRLRQIQNKNPSWPKPRQVILLMRYYHIREPGEKAEFWQGPDTIPVARWQPGVKWQDNYQVLERWNPVTKRFESWLK